MAEVKVHYDSIGNTLTVWFGNPQDEYTCEETGDEVILMKDKNGKVIGFEKLNYAVDDPPALENQAIAVHVTVLEENTASDSSNRGQRMAAVLEKLEANRAFSDVDPVVWQRKVRDDRSIPE